MVKLTRRYFLAGMGAAIAVPLMAEDLVPGNVKGAKLKVGILSDIHMKIGDGEVAKFHRRHLETAFRKFKEWNVDAVLIAGDLTDHGWTDEFKESSAIWRKVFPDNKNAAGEPVVKVFVSGNHDHFTDRPDEEFAALWKEMYDEDFSRIYKKTIKGYTFIGLHWPGFRAENIGYARPKDLAEQVKKFVDDATKDIPNNKPFFYFQHAHPKNTLNANGAGWGHWDDFNSAARNALNSHPNAIAFSGHSHHPFADEQTIWQKEFTSVGTSSLSYLCIDGEFPENHDNYEDAKSPLNSSRVTLPGHEGMLMSVCDGCVVLEKFDFERCEKVTDDWVIEVPVSGAEPKYSLERRLKESKTPEFAAGAKVTTAFEDCAWETKTKEGEVTKHTGRKLKVMFPPAGCTGPIDKLIDYEVKIESADGKTLARKLILAEHYSRKPDEMREKAKDGQTCVFDASKLPTGQKLRATVAPRNCFFKAGAAIKSTLF